MFHLPFLLSHLGNTYLNRLTKDRNCQLRINLVSWDDIEGYAFYDFFRVADENDGFRLQLGNYSGTAGRLA